MNTVKLPEICDIQYGYAFDSAQFSASEGLPLIRIRDIVRGYSETFTAEKCSDEYVVNNGDILIGMDGEFNISKWQGGKALLNQRVCKLIPKSVCGGYLLYYMPTALKRIEDKTPFVTVKHLSAKELNKVEVPLPPIEQQQHIAAVLDKVCELIDLRKQQLTKLDGLVKSRFVEMFGDPVSNPHGWDIVSFNDCLTSIENGKSFVCDAAARVGDEPAILKLSAATYGVYKPEENKAIFNPDDFVQSAEVHDGDLLFTRKNTPELVGMAAYVFSTPKNLMMPDLIFRLNTKPNCNKVFLWKLINHELYRNQIGSIATGSAKSMSNISKERLGTLCFALPPIELQNKFEQFVKQVDKSKVVVQQSLGKLETLKKSLMQEYFG